MFEYMTPNSFNNDATKFFEQKRDEFTGRFESPQLAFDIFHKFSQMSIEIMIDKNRRRAVVQRERLIKQYPDLSDEEMLDIDKNTLIRGSRILKGGESGALYKLGVGDDVPGDPDAAEVRRYFDVRKAQLFETEVKKYQQLLEEMKTWTYETHSLHMAFVIRSEYLRLQGQLLELDARHPSELWHEEGVEELKRSLAFYRSGIEALAPRGMHKFLLNFPANILDNHLLRTHGGEVFFGFEGDYLEESPNLNDGVPLNYHNQDNFGNN